MVDFDHYADRTPRLNTAGALAISTPTVAALKTALQAQPDGATTFSNANIRSMTKRDLIWACRQRGVAVAGLLA